MTTGKTSLQLVCSLVLLSGIHSFQGLPISPSASPILVPRSPSSLSSTGPSNANFDSVSAKLPNGGGSSKVAGQQINWNTVKRSSASSLASFITWLLIHYTSLSSVQASSLVGLMAGLLFQPPTSAAIFCGSFAGMSSHTANPFQALQLSILLGCVYSTSENWQLGKGGRLGAIACLANLVYYGALHQGLQKFALSVLDIVKTFALVLAPIWCLNAASLNTEIKQNARNDVSLGTQPMVIPAPGGPSYFARYVNSARAVTKALIWGILCHNVLRPHDLRKAVFTLLKSSTVALLAAKKVHVGARWRGPVVAAGLLGLTCSLMVNSTLLPVVYMGSFIGMTGIKSFSHRQMIQAALFATILFQSGILPGFGGRLGVFAFIGVNWSMF